MSKNKGLGRGLDALLSGEIEESSSADQLKTMPVTALQPGKYQPRTFMDPASLESLAESIRAQGIMQPIVVRKVSQDRYEIIAGERRWRAAQLAGLTQVPVIIREIPDEAALAMALIENIQREDLNPIEEAHGLQKLMDRANDGLVREVILATNFTAEGEATAHVIGEGLKKRGIQVTRLARGVPVGSELEFVDLGTIAHALVDRRDA